MYLTVALVIIGIFIFLYRKIRVGGKDERFYRLLGKFNSLPSYYPIIGNAHLLFGTLDNLLGRFLELSNNTPTPFVFWAGHIPAVVVTSLEDIQEITSKCSHRETLGFVEETFLDGIVTQKYDKWRKTRRLLNPAFGPFMMKHYLNVFNEQADITAKILRKRADTGETIDLWPYLVNASIDMTTGVKMNIQVNYGNEYSEAIVKIFNFTIKRVLNPFLHPKVIFDLYMAITGQQKIVSVVHDFARDAVVQAKRKYKLQQLEFKNAKPGDEITHKEPKTTIEILLASHENDPDISEKQMQAEFIHIIAAIGILNNNFALGIQGSESTAIMLGFLMVMFGIYQDIQEKAYQEVMSIMNDRETVTLDDLNQLSYVEQCIKETIRVFTVLPATIRCTNEDLTISGNKVIPANCIIVLVLRSVHENCEFFPNARQWNPENFSPEAVERRPKNSFVGFSLGARACLGAKYAMKSMKTQVIYFLRNFHIRTKRKYEEVFTIMDVMQRSKDGYPVTLNTRRRYEN